MTVANARLPTWSAVVLAGLVAIMSLGGLTDPALYARETANWSMQARAQDWFDLVVAVPALLVAGVWARRRTRRGLVVLAGVLLFTVYTAAVYAFAVHLNALFLVYCATLGVALYGLIITGARLWLGRTDVGLSPRAPRRLIGGFLIAIGSCFAALWLAQLIPAAVTGTPPRDLVVAGLVTNPIHVLDLSFILPLHVIAGIALVRGRALGILLAPVVLVFGTLMSASIALLALLTGGTPVAIVMAVVSIITTLFATSAVRALR